MNIAMEPSAQAWHSSHDQQQSLCPNSSTRDNDADDILLDTFFDHSQQLDSTTFDALLDTKFDNTDDDTSASTSTSTQLSKWRPAHFEEQHQHQSPATTMMEPLNNNTGYAMVTGLPSSNSYPESQPHAYGLPVHATPSHDALPGRMYAPSPFEQQTMTHSIAMRPPGGLDHVNKYHYYPDPTTVANTNDFGAAATSYPQQPPNFHLPLPTVVRQDTTDLLDYDDVIPEEDGPGAGVNDEAADLCYAQLLYRCLLDAPDHTMALKDVYEWVRLHSQKARDSTTTGWQNSVRHNLSMNAVSRAEASTCCHDTLF